MLLDKSILELSVGLRKNEFSVTDIINECYQNIDNNNSKINAFITIIPKEEVLIFAKEAENKLAGSNSKLLGIPFVLKDCYVTKNIKTTSASNVLNNFIPPYNATVYQKLINAGAILVGKMNMDAWGHGGSSENTDFGPVKNPWDTSRVAGGSSGGPAAAISARMAAFAIGEDTGGSIRNPAGWCNITGLKVTYGRVSRYGSIAYASSLDSVGPMAKTAEDCAIILEAIAGQDPLDATSSPKPVSEYFTHLNQPLKTAKIGIAKEMFGPGLNSEMKDIILNAAKSFEKRGCELVDVSLETTYKYGVYAYHLTVPSETSSNLARYDGIRYGNSRDNFTPETQRRIMVGTYSLSAGYYDAYYLKAQKIRTLIRQEFAVAHQLCDFILMPVNPAPPTVIGQLIGDPLQNMLFDIYTGSINLAGLCSLAFPVGFTKNNLPVGVQIVGPMFSEDVLLRIGHQFQQLTDYHLKSPPL